MRKRERSSPFTQPGSKEPPVEYGHFSCDARDTVVSIDTVALGLLGRRKDKRGTGRSFVEVFRVGPSERARIHRAMRKDSGRFLGEVNYERESGEAGVLLLWEERMGKEGALPGGSEGFFTDVTETRKWEKELVMVGREIAGSLDEEAIVDRIAIVLSRVSGCRVCSVVVFDEDGIKANVRSGEKPGSHRRRALARLISQGIGAFLEYAIESMDITFAEKTLPLMAGDGGKRNRPLEPGITIPLLIGTSVVGIVHLAGFADKGIRENTRRFLFSVSPQLAFALHNARSFAKQRQLVQMKSDFLSNLSHSLRTPMATMKQTVSMLRRERGGPITEVQRKFLQILDQNIERLTGVLNNLLDLSKIEYGSMHLNRTEVDIVLLVKSIAAAFEATILEKDMKLRVRATPGSIRAFVDCEIMRQVIEGILGNAIKFTERGKKITVKITGGEKRVKIAVEDEGCGMTKENAALAFDKYRSFQVGIREGVKGTGLGLALTKELVELHGGRIWIESEPGEGTRVSFVIPRIPFASILQEKTRRSIELARIRGEKLFLFLFIADHRGAASACTPAKRMREKLTAYLGPLVRGLDGQIIADEEESRVALLVPASDANEDSVERAIRRNMKEFIGEMGEMENSLFSWAKYPDSGATFAELLRALLSKVGTHGRDVLPIWGRG